jgi:hypothetical protein
MERAKRQVCVFQHPATSITVGALLAFMIEQGAEILCFLGFEHPKALPLPRASTPKAGGGFQSVHHHSTI